MTAKTRFGAPSPRSSRRSRTARLTKRRSGNLWTGRLPKAPTASSPSAPPAKARPSPTRSTAGRRDRLMRTEVATTRLKVTPGVPTMLDIAVTNTSDVIDGITAVVTGLDPDWVQLTVPVVSLFPESSDSLTFRILVPKTCLAGEYPVTIEVVSLVDPGRRSTHECWVSVDPIQAAASMELRPSLVIAGKRAEFDVVLTNEGNIATDLAVTALEETRVLSCLAEPGAVTVPANETRAVVLHAAGTTTVVRSVRHPHDLRRSTQRRTPARGARHLHAEAAHPPRRPDVSDPGRHHPAVGADLPRRRRPAPRFGSRPRRRRPTARRRPRRGEQRCRRYATAPAATVPTSTWPSSAHRSPARSPRSTPASRCHASRSRRSGSGVAGCSSPSAQRRPTTTASTRSSRSCPVPTSSVSAPTATRSGGSRGPRLRRSERGVTRARRRGHRPEHPARRPRRHVPRRDHRSADGARGDAGRDRVHHRGDREPRRGDDRKGSDRTVPDRPSIRGRWADDARDVPLHRDK